MVALKDSFTSTGAKFFAHEEAMRNLRNGKGQPVVTHLMPTDVCNHKCAFCSVQTRAGDRLKLADMAAYLDTLIQYGLKAVIISGGGNPILYRCPDTGANFDDLIEMVRSRNLDIGLITNGVPLKTDPLGRKVWKTCSGASLDALTWLRISMAGLDHKENEVYVPDIDPERTTLGFSYVLHDIYEEPADPFHGKVSTVADLITKDNLLKRTRRGVDRIPVLTDQIRHYAETYNPRYVRVLPNCLEPHLIPQRVGQLRGMADEINASLRREAVFVQNKPPAAPRACYLGYVHPVLNADGYVYPCDSCVLNETGHKFAEAWRVCHWSEVAKMYDGPANSLIKDPSKMCPGCVFKGSNDILTDVREGTIDPVPPAEMPEHVNFV